MGSPTDRERLALIREQLDLIDERCDRYETEWNAQGSPLIETYLEGVDSEVRKSLWLELVMIDQQLRQRIGETPLFSDYEHRCPDKSIILDVSTVSLHSVAAPDRTEADPGLDPRNSTHETTLNVPLAAMPITPSPDVLRDPGMFAHDSDATIPRNPNVTDRLLTATRSPDDTSRPPDSHRTWNELVQDRAAALDDWALTLGGTVLGDYELIGKLGQGGMGIVFKARQKKLNRIVALKTIIAGALADSRQIRLFQREAEAVAALDHPNIVPILESGKHENLFYYSMKLIAGKNLQESLDRFKNRPDEIAGLLSKAAGAIHHAHQRGVLHRDLKPSNILVDDQNEPHVIDFGLATRLEIDGEASWASTASFAGTPSFMSPEQAQGLRGQITIATDVYGLGTVLYTLLTGRTPFRARTVQETIQEVIHKEPRRPRALNPRTDLDLETICLKCLEKDPAKRYLCARDLADDLDRRLKGKPILARPTSLANRAWKYTRRHPVSSALLSMLLLTAAIGSGGIIWQWRQAVGARAALQVALGMAKQNEDDARKSEDLALHLAYAAKLNLAERDWRDDNTTQVLHHLEETRPRPGKPDLRNFEWYYLDRLCHSHERTLAGHTDFVLSVAYSPDGRRLVSASQDATLRLWNIASGQTVHTLAVGKIAHAVVFHPDGTRFASAGDDQLITLWDVGTGQTIRNFQGHTQPIRDLSISLDGKTLASSSRDGTVRLWKVDTGVLAHTLNDHLASTSNEICDIAFSPDGKMLAAAGGGEPTARLWDVATGHLIRTLKDDGPNPDGNLALGPDGKAHTGQRRTGTERQRKPVAFSPDGKALAFGTGDGTINVWDVRSGSLVRVLRDHRNLEPITGLAYSPEGKRLASSSFMGQAINLWGPATGYLLRTIKGYTGVILDTAFSPDGAHIASACLDGKIRIWDTTRDQEARSLETKSAVLDVAFGPDGSFLASAGKDRTITLWDRTSGQVIRTLVGHTATVRCVALGGNGPIAASAGDDRSIRIWDVATGKEIRVLKGHTAPIGDLAFSPDGKTLASASGDRTVKLWETETGREIRTFNGHIDEVNAIAFSHDGKTLASGGNDGFVLLWELATGRQVLAIKAHPDGVPALALSPDGRWLAAGGYVPSIKIWNIATGREAHALSGHALAISELAFSPDSRRLASAASDRSVRLWDPVFGHEVLVLRGHTGPVFGVAFSPDGKQVVSGSDDQTVRLWETGTGPEVAKIK
jgi:WD40 repeat protein/serine/threonine protein kinase